MLRQTLTTTGEPEVPQGLHGLAAAAGLPAEALRGELLRRVTLDSFEAFLKTFPPKADYVWAWHVRTMISELQGVTEAVEAGRRAYLILNLPQRHSKSDISSRRWALWHRLRNPEHEVILASYNYEMASGLSWDARELALRVSPLYGLSVAQGRGALASWRWQGHRGAFHSTGIGGTIVGRGADILLIDDYFKNREEAESETIREKRWHACQSDLFTRLSPAHGVVLVAQRWHEDDLVGRILAKNNPKDAAYDKHFPVFRLVRFPAWDDKRGWLFPERYSNAWYEGQRSFMGNYAWQSQAMQDPSPRMGRLLRADKVNYIAPADVPDGLPWARGWDFARTAKERTKDDPDFTVGTKSAVDKDGFVWVADVVRGQWSTLKRDRLVRAAAEADGAEVLVYMEVGPDSGDAYNYVRQLLRGVAVVRKVLPRGDPVARAQRLEAAFEAGRVNIVRGPWNDAWVSEFLSFPGGRHDDQVVSLGVSLAKAFERGWVFGYGGARSGGLLVLN